MKRIALAIGGSLICVQCSIGFTAATNITSYTGEIMDSHCAKMGSHETMKQEGGIQTEKAMHSGLRQDGREICSLQRSRQDPLPAG